MHIDYDEVFSEGDREVFDNVVPTKRIINEVKKINKKIDDAVAEDSVEGYLRAAKLLEAKKKLLKIGPAQS